MHIRGGQFYRWAVTGWVHAAQSSEEARSHLELRYRLSALAADQYCDAGFTTVVQDNIFGPDVPAWLGRVGAHERHLVVLRPSLAVVAERDRARQTATGKIAYRPGEFSIEQLDSFLDETPRIGLWLDTSSQSPAQTVAEIMDRQSEASVDGSI